MAWFHNCYECERCGSKWTDDWSCMCDDDCPHCGARHMSPYESRDLTEIIVAHGSEFVVLRSPDTAERQPNYFEASKLSTRDQLIAYLENNVRTDGIK